MKILFVTAFSAVGSTGGSPKVVRALMHAMRDRGHEVSVVQIYVEHDIYPGIYFTLDQYKEMGLDVRRESGGGVTFTDHEGFPFHLVPGFVLFHKLEQLGTAQAYVLSVLKKLNPDCIIANDMLSDYHAWLYGTLVDWNSKRIVNIIQTGTFFPFGPATTSDPGMQVAHMMHSTKTIVPGKYVRDYLKRWAGLESKITYFPMYGKAPYPTYSDFDDGTVTLTNVNVQKGADIFYQLAARLPDIHFAGIKLWGHAPSTTKPPNVTHLRPVSNIDHIFCQTRILLSPSVLPEAFPLTIVEAMLRGIPVVASDAGGSVEAKLGVDHVIPIKKSGQLVWVWDQTTSRFTWSFPELGYDIEPFYQALVRLLSDRDHYMAVAAESKEAAMQFVSRLNWDYVIQTIFAML